MKHSIIGIWNRLIKWLDSLAVRRQQHLCATGKHELHEEWRSTNTWACDYKFRTCPHCGYEQFITSRINYD